MWFNHHYSLGAHGGSRFSLLTFIDGGSYLSRRGLPESKRFEDLAGKRIARPPERLAGRLPRHCCSTRSLPNAGLRSAITSRGSRRCCRAKVEAYASDRSLLIGLALDSGSQNPTRWSIGPETFSIQALCLMMCPDDAAFRLAVYPLNAFASVAAAICTRSMISLVLHARQTGATAGESVLPEWFAGIAAGQAVVRAQRS